MDDGRRQRSCDLPSKQYKGGESDMIIDKKLLDKVSTEAKE